MKLGILLYGMKIKLNGLAKKNQTFQEKIKEKNFTLQIRTADNKTGRYFTFDNGSVITKRGVHPEPQVAMVWQDQAKGYEVMKGGKQEEFMKAIQGGDVKIEGDASLILWFMDALKAGLKKKK